MLLDCDARNLNMQFMSSDVYRQTWLKFARQQSIKPEQWQFLTLIFEVLRERATKVRCQDVWHSVPDGN